MKLRVLWNYTAVVAWLASGNEQLRCIRNLAPAQ